MHRLHRGDASAEGAKTENWDYRRTGSLVMSGAAYASVCQIARVATVIAAALSLCGAAYAQDQTRLLCQMKVANLKSQTKSYQQLAESLAAFNYHTMAKGLPEALVVTFGEVEVLRQRIAPLAAVMAQKTALLAFQLKLCAK